MMEDLSGMLDEKLCSVHATKGQGGNQGAYPHFPLLASPMVAMIGLCRCSTPHCNYSGHLANVGAGHGILILELGILDNNVCAELNQADISSEYFCFISCIMCE